jgi:hypothetical protein
VGQLLLPIILYVVDKPSGLAIKTYIGDHAIHYRICSYGNRDMVHYGLFIGVSIVIFDRDRLLLIEITKAAFAEALFKTHWQIAVQLICHNLQNQFWFFEAVGTSQSYCDS